jgi:hypothetical protein
MNLGVTIDYEFLTNNAGIIQVYTDESAFYLSRYSSNYHQVSKFIQYFLMAVDIIYILGLLFMTISFRKPIKTLIYSLYKFQEFTVEWYEVVDGLMIVTGFTTLIFWGLTVINPPALKLPINTEEDFQKFVELANLTFIFAFIIAINTIFICLRALKIMFLKFPASSALFDTIKFGILDLTKLLLALFVSSLGFIYAMMLITGPYNEDKVSFFECMVDAVYLTFGLSQISDKKTLPENFVRIFNIAEIIYSVIFYFILAKLTACIVIVRYIYLRS